MGDQAGGHSLPAGEGVVGRQCVDLDALLCTHDVDRADGGGSGRDVGDVAGLAERAVQRVLHDGHRMQGDNLRGLAQPLLDVAAADKLGDRVDEGHMARPAGAGGDDVCAALGDVVDDLGVVIDVGVGREMHIFHRHAQLRIDLLVQILDHGVNKAGFVSDGGDVALIVRPFVLGKDMNLGAVNLEVVDELRQRDVGFRLGIAEDHGEGLACLGGSLQTAEQRCDQHRMRVHHDLDIEFRMPPVLTLFQFLAAHFAHALTDLAVLEGDEFGGVEVELGCGFGNKVFHCNSPLKKTFCTFIL